MKRKKRNEPKNILEKATKEARRMWGYDYPFSSAILNPFGMPIVFLFVVGAPNIVLGQVLRETSIYWVRDLYSVIAAIPLFYFAWRSRKRVQPYLEKVLAELNNPVCRKCKYDLRGLTDFNRCPECGTPVIWVEPTDAEG